MKRIAVAGKEAKASADLISRTLAGASGWKVAVVGDSAPLGRLEEEGCQCAVSVLRRGKHPQNYELGVYTGGGGTPDFSRCGRLVLSLDDPWSRQLANSAPAPVFTYSERRDQADLTAKNLQLVRDRVEFEALTDQDIRRVRLPMTSTGAIYPSLAALGCGLSLGLPLEKLVQSIEEVARQGQTEPKK